MRLLEILFYLLRSSSKVTIKELATVYNVSPRTIQRDLDKLSVVGISNNARHYGNSVITNAIDGNMNTHWETNTQNNEELDSELSDKLASVSKEAEQIKNHCKGK